MESNDDKEVREFLQHPFNTKSINPSDPLIQGLEVLKQEATDPDKQAIASLEHGISFLRYPGAGSLHEAMNSYDEGLNHKSPNKETNRKLLLERAKCNLKLENYGHCISDLDYAIGINKLIGEQYEVKIMALNALKNYDKIKECYTDALNNGIKELSKTIIEIVKKAIQEIESKKAQKVAKKKLKKEKLVKQNDILEMMKSKKIKIGERLHHLPETLESEIRLTGDNKLHFPILLMYEEFMQCDIIKDAVENSILEDQLTQVFNSPLPWDTKGIYTLKNIVAYIETNASKPIDPSCKIIPCSQKYKKINLRSTILEILQDEHYVMPQFPVIHIFANKGSDFLKSFLEKEKQ